MLSTECFPREDEMWEELPKNKKYWPGWENMYKAADRKAKVKKQSVGGQYQFGATHGGLRQTPKIQEDQQIVQPGQLLTSTNILMPSLRLLPLRRLYWKNW